MTFTSRSAFPMFGSRHSRSETFLRSRRRRLSRARAFDRLEDRTMLSTMLVSTIDDSGAGSLRQAIIDVNNDLANPSADTIAFAIPGASVHTIQPLSQLPNVTHPVFIDGYTQPGSSQNTLATGDNAVLTIELDGSQAGYSIGLLIDGGQSTVRGLVVNRFASQGIAFDSSGSGNILEGDFVGTDPTGTIAEGNGLGVNVVGDGNLIGTNGDGVADLAERNLISGNGSGFYSFGVLIQGASNVVAGNYIGIDATGLLALGNGGSGVSIENSGAHSNRIGTDGHSVDNIAERNVISANGPTGQGSGVVIGAADDNVVAGNYIGTDATGEHPLGNGSTGMSVNGNGNRVGTDGDGSGDVAEGNVISANGFMSVGTGYNDGVALDGADNVIAGNYIGTDAAGTIAMGNAWVGIDVLYGGPNRIGTNGDGISDVAERNVIAANGAYGISDQSVGGHLIAGNFIGTDVNGQPMGNGGAGIWGLDSGDQIGGSPALANVIAYNNGGVIVANPNAIGVIIRCNSIHDNAWPLILEGPNGPVRDNDAGDLDTGANGLQNFPVLSSAVGGAATTVTGDLNSHPNTTFLIDLYAAPVTNTGSGGGRYLGTTTVTTDAAGNVHFVATVNAPTALNELISATATGPEGTSEYSDFLSISSVIQPSSLSGTVFSDFNDDGQVDFGEQGIAGVTITLDGIDFLGDAVHLSQASDGDGAYVFLNLLPGSYTITGTQPAGYTQGINTVGTAGGTVAGDQFTITGLAGGIDGLNYNYGEQPAATGVIQKGQTAGIGFWNNKNGQALIKDLNGGSTSTQLGNWLAATFPHMFGASSGNSNLTGKSNADVASFFQGRFVVKDQKLDAQVLATALAVYVTDAALDTTGVGAQYGFVVAGNGVGTSTFNVGSNGAAFGVANNAAMTVLDLLVAADAQAVNGVLYDGNTAKRNMANSVFSAINDSGGL